MQLALTLVAADPAALPSPADIARAIAAVGRVKEPRPLGPGALDLAVEADTVADVRTAARAALTGRPVDVCVQPWNGRRKRLLVADMDSTIIGVECIDELADYAGVKAEIAAITERAMRGELNFETALRQRVARLAGLAESVLAQCYDERVRLNPGARPLVRTMAANGARCVLVSGGFTHFAERVAAAAGFAAQRSNRLVIEDGRLSGAVTPPILGADAKLQALLVEAADIGATAAETLAVGDGANDLGMVEAAGLGVAYRAHGVLAQRADARIEHADLTAALFFQGYKADAFMTD
jgi:phosphoserine phosphatase